MTDRTATLTFSDGSPQVTLPVLPGSVGPDVIDIRTLYGKTGRFTYDPGFLSTAACHSTITFIDGDKGVLLYRGYPIEELAVKCDFLDVCYLLLYGDLPNAARQKEFDQRVTRHTMVHEQMQFFLRGFRRDAHPMAVLTGLVGALSAFYPDSMNLHDPKQRDISAIRLIAKLPTLVAMAYKYSLGEPYVYPRNELDYASNFMRMMFATPCEDYKLNPVLVRALDRILSCTPTTSRTRRPRPFGCARRRAPIRSRRSPRASPASGARRTAAPTRPRSTCSTTSRPRGAWRRSASSSRRRRTRTRT